MGVRIDHEPVERVLVWVRRVLGGQVEMDTVLNLCCKSGLREGGRFMVEVE
jgi:hypothetical protein